MGTPTRSDVIKHILKKQEQKKDIRRDERKLPYSQTDGFGDLEGIENMSEAQKAHALLSQYIPSYLMPTNVGELAKVLWPKWYEVDFTVADHAMFGNNPTVKPQDQSKKSFRTVQDAGFLLLGVSRNFNTHGTAGKGTPLEVTLRDNQSSRQINNLPIALQSFGHGSIRTDLVAPYYFLPNSSFGIEIQTFVENDMVLAGDGSQQFTFFGLEVRSGELENILHTIYSAQVQD
jgi:hypothetical protein